ncbi:MAG: DUF2911 domain-containing protein [Balneolaceae bacterium]
MKSIGMIAVLVSSVFLLAGNATAQERANDEPRVSPNAEVSQTIGTTEVYVTYGRPSVNEREIFGGLEPFDVVWRTGANEATTISFSDDVVIEGETLEEGIYGLFTIPGEDGQWTIIFNNVSEQWGAFNYEDSEDVLRVEVNAEDSHFLEQMMIYFEDVTESSANLVIHWDETKVPVQIETN